MNLLEKARAYEQSHYTKVAQQLRPFFHLSAPVGWLNDPNGFSVFQSEYHLFYQYHPFSLNWGPMYWGHSKTNDFIKWEYLPPALAPDEEYDGQGCFSGSALEFEGKHVLMYTGVLEKENQDGTKYVRQTQNIAVGDGKNYHKLSCNPVITAKQLPPGSSAVDFRDPKIWRDGEYFYSIIGSRSADGSGQLALFSSNDLKTWNFVSIVERCCNEYGTMWECPDFFYLDGKTVILSSPQDMEASGLEFHNGNGTLYLTGTFIKETNTLKRERIAAIDYGLDFYAPQTLESPDGRRIMIGWMQSWDSHILQKDCAWSGMMSIPRELAVKKGKLYQNPVKELEVYWENKVQHHDVKITDNIQLEGINGRSLDILLEVQMDDNTEFEIRLAVKDNYYTILSYNSLTSIMSIDRTYCGLKKDYISRRDFYVYRKDGKIKLRILLDKYSVEVFANGGEQAATMIITTPLEANQIMFGASKQVTMDIVKYDVKI